MECENCKKLEKELNDYKHLCSTLKKTASNFVGEKIELEKKLKEIRELTDDGIIKKID